MVVGPQELPRRSVLRAAVAVGGSVGLAACLAGDDEPSIPSGSTDTGTIPEAQHAWEGALRRDDHGNVTLPRHHVLLLLEYQKNGPPSADDRTRLEAVLQSIEEAVARGPDGILFTISYGSAYFDRFSERLPASAAVPEPEPLSSFENPTRDRPDALLHLASDKPAVLLAIEAWLGGERSIVNGVSTEPLTELLAIVDRRTGFVGSGLPAANQDVAGVPPEEPVADAAPMFMGFTSGFERNQASESSITIDRGPFEGGTTVHLSRLRLHLEQWYNQDTRFQRVGKMFCPLHAHEERVDGVGTNLGTDTGVSACSENLQATASEEGFLGHAQKAATVRRKDEPLLLRRDFNSTDDGAAGVHFLSLQRSIDDFVRTRTALNAAETVEASSLGQRVNNGILQYFSVRNRGNYLLPPRRHRSLPSPEGTP